MSVTHEEVVKAEQARLLLESDVFKEATENLKNEYITHWLNSRDIGDVNIREDLHRSLLLLPEVERHLRIMAEKGKLTKANINKIRNIG